MVDSLFNACSTAGKPCPTPFHRLHPDLSGISVDGVAQHWAVDYDVQVILMGAVIETGSSTVADLVSALPGHPAPVAAIMALVDAGHLSRAPGVLTPFTVISCGRDIERKSPPGSNPDDGAPRRKWPSTSRTLIAFPNQRSEGKESSAQSVGTNGLERMRVVCLVNTFARRSARLIAWTITNGLWSRQHSRSRARAEALASGTAS